MDQDGWLTVRPTAYNDEDLRPTRPVKVFETRSSALTNTLKLYEFDVCYFNKKQIKEENNESSSRRLQKIWCYRLD